MKDAVTALINAADDLLTARVWRLVLWPMLFALVLWGGAAYAFWRPATQWLHAALISLGVGGSVLGFDLSVIRDVLAPILLLVLLIPLTYATALIVTAFVAMPTLLDVVATRRFPHLERKRGGSDLGSVTNALSASGIYALLWIVTLPLWLVPPLPLVLPVLLSAYFNQRLFRYDALALHASRSEMEHLRRSHGAALWLLGIALAAAGFIPLFNLIAPVYIALGYIHFCLRQLDRLRAATSPPLAVAAGSPGSRA
jgi:CysZ protein